MAKNRMPKRPKIGAAQSTWDRYEAKMKLWAKHKNEIIRRKGVKERIVSTVKVS